MVSFQWYTKNQNFSSGQRHHNKFSQETEDVWSLFISSDYCKFKWIKLILRCDAYSGKLGMHKKNPFCSVGLNCNEKKKSKPPLTYCYPVGKPLQLWRYDKHISISKILLLGKQIRVLVHDKWLHIYWLLMPPGPQER